MNETDEMDAEIQAVDLKIAKKEATIKSLEAYADEILAKIQRHKQDLRRLGQERAEKSTFKLHMDT